MTTTKSDLLHHSSSKIVVDVVVANCQIRAAKPVDQSNFMPNTDDAKVLWFELAPASRLNNRIYGTLKGRGLKKAQKLINENGGINISAENMAAL